MDSLFSSQENVNPDYLISSLIPDEKEQIALAQNDGTKTGNLKTKRWQNRTCLEVLERYQNASALLSISVANVTLKNSTNHGGYAFALLGLKI
ncbi:unnamed protein product [Rhizophagus irregularis]|nr:unnamed protein product [Rhizophagus irregularis]CAB5388412.1 unnamed protein product [Rhizophagus irregularis]